MRNSTTRRRTTRFAIAAISATAGAALLATAVPAGAATRTGDTADRAVTVVEKATGTVDIANSTPAPGTPAKAETRTERGLVTVSTPARATGSVTATSEAAGSLALTLPGAKGAEGVKAGAGTVVYPDAASSTDVAVQPTTDGGARALVTLKDAKAPEEQRFGLELPPGAEISGDGEEGFEITKETAEGVHLTLGTIEAPWAKDANGRPVPTGYRLDGTSIVQTVRVDDETAFPVVADPKFTWGIVTGTGYFNKAETKKIANNGALVAMGSWALPPGLNAYVTMHAAAITKVALSAKANKRCIKIKFAAGLFVPGEYSGGYCK
ncbi:hypothetical protein [Streptomyces sp. AM6-12]|uniref:hypothetical protein n=1 Tax=Streptomyces sp. AM6-12 TaxID=3345149 RepID=UPI0037A870AE